MEKKSILVKDGRVIDPANSLDEVLNILITDGKIAKVGKNIKNSSEIIDAKGKIVIPGLVDMHVHLREPGREDKETVCSGTKAALYGGVTSLLAMPNTYPAIDSPENARILKEIIRKSAKCNVFICGAITKERCGTEPTDTKGLKKEGAIAISDDGASVESEEIMLSALKRAKEEGLLTICHSEDKALSKGGVVNLGFTSTRMGLRGISKESEYKRVARDIELAERAATKVHIAHVSCLESVEIIAKAKKKKIPVTCETAPHYFALNEETVLRYDTNFKMNPPLRGKADMQAIREALRDGIIDVIASDHAPHTENEKDIEFERAEFGVTGLETELSVAMTELVANGFLDWPGLVKKMSLNPAIILGIPRGTLKPGSFADIVIIDPGKEWVVDREKFISKSQNNAFIGKKLKGKAEYTVCNGKVYAWNS
ncbi:MAG: dihydroorotase [Candidatus Omnitrophica bacterium]|nr:dihydroorotase [Candidatus Omnitrophota bacterium]